MVSGGKLYSMSSQGRADDKKNPAAVALGRLGGRKGGKARAERLTAERRAEIARQGAMARWAGQRKRGGETAVRSKTA